MAPYGLVWQKPSLRATPSTAGQSPRSVCADLRQRWVRRGKAVQRGHVRGAHARCLLSEKPCGWQPAGGCRKSQGGRHESRRCHGAPDLPPQGPSRSKAKRVWLPVPRAFIAGDVPVQRALPARPGQLTVLNYRRLEKKQIRRPSSKLKTVRQRTHFYRVKGNPQNGRK